MIDLKINYQVIDCYRNNDKAILSLLLNSWNKFEKNRRYLQPEIP